jgi:hypothetical protein
LQWLQDPSEVNGDNLNNVRREASRHFRNNKREYLKDKINELPLRIMYDILSLTNSSLIAAGTHKKPVPNL